MVNEPDGGARPPADKSTSSEDETRPDPSSSDAGSDASPDPGTDEPSYHPDQSPAEDTGSSVELESVARESDLDHTHAVAVSPRHHHHEHDAASDSGQSSREDVPPDDEDGGGPVKSFIEHLEDLRWMLIKCLASIIIGMVVCLVAANQLISALDWPLQRAQIALAKTESVTLFMLGTNVMWRFQQSELADWGFPLGTNRVEVFQVVPTATTSNSFALLLERDATKSDQAPRLISLKTYTPLGPFSVALQLALYGGIGLSSPFVLYFIGQFVVPALRRSEKKFVFQALGFGTLLFITGMLFCYFIMVQIAIHVAVTFSHWLGFGADEWRVEEYISFVCKFMLGMGLAFELPVVILTLVKVGMLDYAKLTRFRPYWIVINLIISSLLTPPDPISMFLMAIPLQILYEISVFISRYWGLDRRLVRRGRGGS